MNVILDFETFLFVSFVWAKKKGDSLNYPMSDQFQGRVFKTYCSIRKINKGSLCFMTQKSKKKERIVLAITEIWKEAMTSTAKSNKLET